MSLQMRLLQEVNQRGLSIGSSLLLKEIRKRELWPQFQAHIKTVADTEIPEILKLAEDLEPSLRRAFLAAVRKVQNRIDLERLAAAIRANQLTAAEAAAEISTFPEAFGGLAGSLKSGFTLGAGLGIRQLADAGVSLSFTLVNPQAVEYAKRQTVNLATPFKAQAKEVIRDAVEAAVSNRSDAYEAAKKIRDYIGLDPNRVHRANVFYENLLENGVPDSKIEARVGKFMDALIRERAETIARTEIHRASLQGELAAWQAASDQGLIDTEEWVKVWHVTDDERLCAICEPLDGLEVGLFENFPGVDNGFGEATDIADAHVNCRCYITRERK